MKRARLLRYARCQMADFVYERGLMVVVLCLLNISGLIVSILSQPPEARAKIKEEALGLDVLIIFVSLIMLAVLFSSQELISRPRKLSYYRLLFAKPVNPVVYYAQLFVVHLIGTVIVVTAITAVFSAIALPMYIAGIAALTAIGFVLLGGIGFLLSVFINHDSVVTVAIIGLSYLGEALSAKYTGILVSVLHNLLPLDHVFALKGLLMDGPVAAGDVIWVLGYGVIAFLLGLVALRYKQLAD